MVLARLRWRVIEQILENMWFFRAFVGDEVHYTNQLSWGLLKINHEIRIPSLNHQDSRESKAGFFSWLKLFFFVSSSPKKAEPKSGSEFF